MTGDLPLAARLGVRENWSREDAPVQTFIRKLEEVLGHKVVVEPEWPLLITELNHVYSDGRALVASIAGTVEVWCKSMVELLENETAHESWSDILVEKLKTAGHRLALFVDVDASSTAKPRTFWAPTRVGFAISLPKAKTVEPNELFSVFCDQLLQSFEPGTDGNSKHAATHAVQDADEWADEVIETITSSSKATGQSRKPQPVAFLPTTASLPRPEQLLLQPPYYLHMSSSNTGMHSSVVVQCSHSPSLQLLADYLKRWCRTNHQDSRRPPAISVMLHQSAFGLGEMYDRLVLGPHDSRYREQFQVTAPMMVVLVEKVLGYELVSTSAGGDAWHFRRDAEIKTL